MKIIKDFKQLGTFKISQLLEKRAFYYDIETFPNFFSALFISEDFQDEFVFYKFGDRDDLKPLAQFVQQPNLLLVGFNSIHYDDPMLRFIIGNQETTNENIYQFSKDIIERKRNELSDSAKQIVWGDSSWLSVDMMALLTSNMNRPSLKHCGIHLEHPRLQDLPKKPTAKVRPNEVEEILDYNRNDVVITGKLYNHPEIQKALELRIGLAEIYGDLEHLIYADDSKIGNVILTAEYGTPERKGTRRSVIHGRDLVPPTLEFKTDTMREVEDVVRKMTLIEVEDKEGKIKHLTYPKRKAFEHVFEFNGTVFKMAKGGLHSEDEPRILRSKEDVILRDADVGSYYPSLGDYYGLIPAHLDRKKFQRVRKDLITRRLVAKHSGDKVTADGLKITINGMFGKMNYVGFWLYDPLPFFQTTLYGQFLLLMLIEMLYLEGITCVSANTDGIVCEIPKDMEQVYFDTCVEWQKKTGMSLEYTDYNFLVQKNVNSYMSHAVREGVHNDDWSVSWKDKDDIKTKKDFSDNKYLVKQSFVRGYQAPIIAIALQNYYKDSIPVEDTVMGEENIHNFFFTQKTGKKFDMFFVTPDGTRTKQQKTNRFYVTTSGGVLIKKDRNKYAVGGLGMKSQKKGENSIWKGQFVSVLNDTDVEERSPVKRQFYIDKIQEIINEIEPPKVYSIFDFVN